MYYPSIILGICFGIFIGWFEGILTRLAVAWQMYSNNRLCFMAILLVKLIICFVVLAVIAFIRVELLLFVAIPMILTIIVTGIYRFLHRE